MPVLRYWDGAAWVDVSCGGGGGGGVSSNQYWVTTTTPQVDNPTPTSYVLVAGMTITLPASAVARTAFVSSIITFSASHTNRFTIFLDGVINPTGSNAYTAHQQGGDTTYDTQFSDVPISIPGDNATHVIAIYYQAADSTTTTTFSYRTLTVMTAVGSTSPIALGGGGSSDETLFWTLAGGI